MKLALVFVVTFVGVFGLAGVAYLIAKLATNIGKWMERRGVGGTIAGVVPFVFLIALIFAIGITLVIARQPGGAQ